MRTQNQMTAYLSACLLVAATTAAHAIAAFAIVAPAQRPALSPPFEATFTRADAAPPSPRGAPLVFPEPLERLRVLKDHRVPPEAVAIAPRAPGQLADPGDYDVRHILLDIDVTDIDGMTVRGAVTHRLESRVQALPEIVFDLIDELEVDSVLVDGIPRPYSHALNLVRISLAPPLPLGESAVVRVVYNGSPPQGLGGLRFQSDPQVPRPFVWTQSQPNWGRYWWPCKDRPDDKADSALIRIVVPDWMTATSNGLLRGVEEGPGWRAFTWAEIYPIAPYLISVTAGDFIRIDDVYTRPDGGTMPLEHYVFPFQEAAARESFNIAAEGIDAFAARFGPYPFPDEKYGVTVYGWSGAMEHQCNTSYFWRLVTGEHSWDWLYMHELAHMWWGDAVTCATWADSWLNEGFASWGEAVWFEHVGGFEAYRDYMTGVQLVWDPSGPLYGHPNPFDGNTIYNKGAWAVHMLRGVLGDSLFFPALADYRAAWEGRTVTTAQMRATFEESTERDLGWFFDQWIHGRNRPDYRVATLTEETTEGNRVYIHLDQAQRDTPYFHMPVRIRVTSGEEDPFVQDIVFWNDPDHEDLVVDVPSLPVSVQVDPDHWILRTVTTGEYGLNLVTTELAPAFLDSAVVAPLIARGGTPPYTWAAEDPLPPGTNLNAESGEIAGRPEVADDFRFRITVFDNSDPGRSDTQLISWSIREAPADTGDVAPPAITSRIRVVPNPAVRSASLSFRSEAGGPAQWRVVDIGGRVVASMRTGTPDDTDLRHWVWDGRAAGRRLPAGVYWIRAWPESEPDKTVTGRVVLVD